MKFFKRHAFIIKLTCVFLVGVMLMPFIMNVIWIRHSRKILVEQFVKESDQVVEQLGINIKNYFDSIWCGVFEITSNENVRKILNKWNRGLTSKEFKANQVCLQNYLDRLRNYNKDIFRVTLLSDDYVVDSIGGRVHRTEIENEKWYQDFVHSDNAVYITGVYYKDFGTGVKTPTISYVQKLSASSAKTSTGIIIVDIRYTNIKNMFDAAVDRERSQLYVFNEGRLIYSPDGFKNEEDLTQDEKALLECADITKFPMNLDFGGQEKILVGKSKEFPKWLILEMVDHNQLVSSADRLFRGLSKIILIIGFLFAILVMEVLYKMMRPLLEIEQKMLFVEQDQFNIRFENPRKDEFGRIENGFNRMITHIEKLLQSVAQEEQKKREMAIKTLRAQINPHFLYNTLNVIRWRAVMDKNEDVSKMIVELIQTMEFNGKRKEEFVSVREELNSLKHYISLLKYQYGDKFDIIYEIDNRVSEYYICKMILQPLVENSVFHGIVPGSRQGKILIQIALVDDRIHFLIKDNGVGVPADQESEMMCGIGISNVNDRLCYYFGEESSLQINNKTEEGVTVMFSIPVLEEIPLARIVL